jgi:hypothetical protein
MEKNTVMLANELVAITAELHNLKAREAELRKMMAEQLNIQPYDHKGYRFQTIRGKTRTRINKKNLVSALASADISNEAQEKIRSEAFDVEYKAAGIRINKLK